MEEKTSTPPEISISLSIKPSSFVPGSAETPTISITATSHATQPITIFTWPTIFHLQLAQRRKNFTCIDLTSNTPVFLEITKGPRRPGFSRTKGAPDEKYFFTLEPETPLTFSHPFILASRATDGDLAMAQGHRYRYAVSDGEALHYWWYGRRDDIMAPKGQPTLLFQASGEPIPLGSAASVEFNVRHVDPAGEKGDRGLLQRSGPSGSCCIL